MRAGGQCPRFNPADGIGCFCTRLVLVRIEFLVSPTIMFRQRLFNGTRVASHVRSLLFHFFLKKKSTSRYISASIFLDPFLLVLVCTTSPRLSCFHIYMRLSWCHISGTPPCRNDRRPTMCRCCRHCPPTICHLRRTARVAGAPFPRQNSCVHGCVSQLVYIIVIIVF